MSQLKTQLSLRDICFLFAVVWLSPTLIAVDPAPLRIHFVSRGRAAELRIETLTECHEFLWQLSQLLRKSRCRPGLQHFRWGLHPEMELQPNPERKTELQRRQPLVVPAGAQAYYLERLDLSVVGKLTKKEESRLAGRTSAGRTLILDSKPRMRSVHGGRQLHLRDWGRVKILR